MFEIAIIKKVQEVREHISRGEHRQAVEAVDYLASRYSERKNLMSAPEMLEFTGCIADLYSRLDESAKEVPFWEDLCRMADNDLAELACIIHEGPSRDVFGGMRGRESEAAA
jgi:hypothetical protein